VADGADRRGGDGAPFFSPPRAAGRARCAGRRNTDGVRGAGPVPRGAAEAADGVDRRRHAGPVFARGGPDTGLCFGRRKASDAGTNRPGGYWPQTRRRWFAVHCRCICRRNLAPNPGPAGGPRIRLCPQVGLLRYPHFHRTLPPIERPVRAGRRAPLSDAGRPALRLPRAFVRNTIASRLLQFDRARGRGAARIVAHLGNGGKPCARWHAVLSQRRPPRWDSACSNGAWWNGQRARDGSTRSRCPCCTWFARRPYDAPPARAPAVRLNAACLGVFRRQQRHADAAGGGAEVTGRGKRSICFCHRGRGARIGKPDRAGWAGSMRWLVHGAALARTPARRSDGGSAKRLGWMGLSDRRRRQ